VYKNEDPGTCTGSHVNTSADLTCLVTTMYGVDVHYGCADGPPAYAPSVLASGSHRLSPASRYWALKLCEIL